MKKCLSLLTLLLLAALARAQMDDIALELPDLDAGEAQAEAWADEWQALRDNPININDSAQVAQLPFLTPLQLQSLRFYIRLHGELQSVAELDFVGGWDEATLRRVRPLVKAEPLARKRSLKELFAHTRHTLVSGMGGTVEQAAGYADGRYEGDNLRAYLCYSLNASDRVSLRLVAEKDPGEAWGRGNFTAGHLMIDNIGRMERLIVGRYSLQFGQGTTLWTGLAPFQTVGGSAARYGTGVRPAATFYEEGYQQGVAATVRLAPRLRLSAFASAVEGERLGGGHLDFQSSLVRLGLTLAHTALADSINPAQRAYNSHYFRGRRLTHGGIDLMVHYGHLLLFGEASLGGDTLVLAAVGGAQWQFGNGNSLSASYRHYAPHYHSLHAAAYGSGGTQNQQGLSLGAQVQLPAGIGASVSLDEQRYTALRYNSYQPSSGWWLRALLRRGVGRHAEATLRYAHRLQQRNVPNSTAIPYLAEETLRQQVQAGASLDLGRFTLRAHAAATRFAAEASGTQHGWMAGAEGRYRHGPWQATAAATYFDVGGYYARIYLSESHLIYNFSMPALTGRGWRCTAMVRYRPTDSLTLGARYALTLLPGQEQLGTGAAAIAAPHRQQWQLQLLWHF